MNLPPPFNKAKDVKANPDGSISLIDAQGNSLARIPLTTAFELLRETKSRGFTRPKRASRQGFYFGAATASGSGFGHGIGEARPYGIGFANGSGESK